MECPKCGLEIDDNAITCPNCKKVLKLVCPICKTINGTNTCKKCGYVMVTKCNNCGKVAPTAIKTCPKCHFSLEKSVIMNEANTDDFAMLTIDFPNLSDMKELLGSVKAFNKFKINLDKVINDYVKSIGLRRQIIGKTYVIRFYKDYSFNASVHTAINSAIEILNLITRLNCKLTKKKDSSIKCNMFLMKKNVDNDPNDYGSGFNINMLQVKSKDATDRVLNVFQILTDSNIFDTARSEYKFSPLNSVMINGQMTMFYELEAKDLVTIDETLLEDKEETDEIEVPNFVQNMLMKQDKVNTEVLKKSETPYDPDSIYDLDSLTFDEINCEFLRIENVDIFYHLVSKLQTVPKGIVAIKAAQIYVPYSLKIIDEIKKLKIYNNIISITCYDEMKYSPYAFFRELVSTIFEYTVSQKLFNKNDFTAFSSIDPKNMIRDLITLSPKAIKDAIDTRNEYFDIFLTLLQVIPNTLIFVENFEKIDSSSFDVLKYLFEEFDKLQVSYLLSFDKQLSLHKEVPSLLTKNYYTEITLKPTPFERIIEENKEFYKNVLDDFYFQRIAKYSCGSILFMDIAIQYLIEEGIYQYTEDGIVMVDPKTVIIASNLDKFFCRRLELLKEVPDAINFLTATILLGTRIDVATIDSLGYVNVEEIIKYLSDRGYVYFYNNCLYFPNYNILKKNLLTVMNTGNLQKIANEILEKVFIDEMPHPVKPYLYTLLGDNDKVFAEWEKLAKVSLLLGDYSAYLNCAGEILELINSRKITSTNIENIEEYKLNLYRNIADNLYVYIPERNQPIAEETLKHLEHSTDIDTIIQLCNKMINGALMTSQYGHALALTHKVLAMIPNASIDPEEHNFNVYFLLMAMVHVQILFNLGALDDCLEIGYKILNVVNESNFSRVIPDYMSEEQFKEMFVDCVGCLALANVVQIQGNIEEFLNLIYGSFSFIPKSFDIFIQLKEFLAGRPVTLPSTSPPEDKITPILTNLLSGFLNINNNVNEFAEKIYQAKVLAKKINFTQIEILCDLLIAHSYVKLGFHEKAKYIFKNIIKNAREKGMFIMEHIGLLLAADLMLAEGQYKLAKGILNGSMLQLDVNGKVSVYLVVMAKYKLYQTFMYLQEFENASITIRQAEFISNKYGFKINFDKNPESYIPIVPEDEESKANSEEPNNAEISVEQNIDGGIQ